VNEAPPDVDVTEREALRALVLREGFTRVGFTTADPVADHVSAWVADGLHADLEWMAREPQRRADPSARLDGARSVVCVSIAYPATDARGPVAGYARGEDYHRTLTAALERAAAALRERHPGTATRVCFDTAPLLERALAARAGLGWIGRNTMLLDEASGPWTLLGEIVTTLGVPPDAPGVDRCGTCTACVDACPTDALLPGRRLDAGRCLSYWTIEHRGPLPDAWAAALGHRAFGCDDCLAACPFPAGTRAGDEADAKGAARGADARPPSSIARVAAASSTDATEPPFVPRPDLATITPAELEARARESFRRHFGSTPLERTRKGGLLRNLAALRDDRGAG